MMSKAWIELAIKPNPSSTRLDTLPQICLRCLRSCSPQMKHFICRNILSKSLKQFKTYLLSTHSPCSLHWSSQNWRWSDPYRHTMDPRRSLVSAVCHSRWEVELLSGWHSPGVLWWQTFYGWKQTVNWIKLNWISTELTFSYPI